MRDVHRHGEDQDSVFLHPRNPHDAIARRKHQDDPARFEIGQQPPQTENDATLVLTHFREEEFACFSWPGGLQDGCAQVGKETTRIPHSNTVAHLMVTHAGAYTAKEIVVLTHISNKKLAKKVIVKIDGTMAMAVLPASYDVDLAVLRSGDRCKKRDSRKGIGIRRSVSGVRHRCHAAIRESV